MNGAMEHKGYIGSVGYSDEDEVFHGKLEGIRDLVTYEGTDVRSLKKAFREAVDDYLATCERLSKEPDTPFKGSFNVRVGAELHKRAAVYAAEHGKKLNAVITEALEHHLK
ncbi:MAG: type II toxin-antitoxin system HicB family antitoxin [Bryobacteraceae bacterium]|jgi:predicted HicB family RNase H-like nuclease